MVNKYQNIINKEKDHYRQYWVFEVLYVLIKDDIQCPILLCNLAKQSKLW